MPMMRRKENLFNSANSHIMRRLTEDI